jgi:hypothetical protein
MVVRGARTRFVGALATIALVVAACGGPAPMAVGPSAAPSPSTAPATQTDVPSASPAASLSAASPGASASATTQPSSSPAPSPAASGVWKTVISADLAYAGFGLAGNGDLIAIAAPSGAPSGTKYEIIRADPVTGEIRSRVALDKRVDINAGNPFYIDPTNDNVITFVSTGTGTALWRLDSKTGQVLRQTKPAVSISQVAIDLQGRLYANTISGPGSMERPELLVRLGSDGTVAARLNVLVTSTNQLQDVGKLAFGYYNFKRIVTYYGWTLALAVSPNGTIQSLQVPGEIGQSEPQDRPYFDTFTPDFTHLRRTSLPLEWPGGSYRWIYWGSFLGMAADDQGTIYLVEPIGPQSNKVEWDGRTRLRAIGADGKVLATWGAGGNRAGLGYPQHVVIDKSGRDWVVDLDPKTHRQSIKVLESAP